MPVLSEQGILEFIIGKLKDLTADLDVGEIAAQTQLKSLGLPSIVLLNALAEIQDHFELQDALFTKMFAGEVPPEDYAIRDIAGYVAAILQSDVH